MKWQRFQLRLWGPHEAERGGVSVFLWCLHTYPTTDRETDILFGIYNWLDMTPFGRQEEGMAANPSLRVVAPS
ncbi:DUF899 family protein [Gracilibacillus kekensis]|uniref:DUF899 family protein n=1 Tax=Gracilibacillus kekensis TaxID=1027249 RepID=UPI000A01977F